MPRASVRPVSALCARPLPTHAWVGAWIVVSQKRTGDVHKVPIGKLPDAIALKQGKSREGYLNF